jgi:hypothetical protein
VNRAPVLTLWAAVVAEVLGFEHDEALTLGRAVAGLNAYSKGVSLGLFQPSPREVKEQRRKMRKEETVTVDLLNRAVPAKHTDEGLRALSGENPIHPENVQKYLESKFGDALEDVSDAMLELAKSLPPSQLAQKAYGLSEKFWARDSSWQKGLGSLRQAGPGPHPQDGFGLTHQFDRPRPG